MSLDKQTIKELNIVLEAEAIEEFASMLVDGVIAHPKCSKDLLISNAAYYSVEKLRRAEREQASIEE